MPKEPQYPNQPQHALGASLPIASNLGNFNGGTVIAAPMGTPANLQVIPLPYYASGNNNTSEDQEFNLRQFLGTLRRRIWVVTGVATIVTLVGWVNVLNQRPVYEGNFRLLIEDIWSTDATDQILAPSASNFVGNADLARINTQLEVLRSPAILKPIHASLLSEYPDLTYETLEENLQVSQLDNTKVLEVRFEGSDPSLVQSVLSKVSSAYLNYSSQQQQNALQQGILFVQNQLPVLQDRVNEKQKQVQEFRQRYTLIDPESRGTEISGLLSNIHSQQQQTQSELVEAQSLYILLQRQVGASPDSALASAALSESSHYQKLLTQIQEVESKIATESARFQMGSPQIQSLMERRSNLIQLMEIEAQRILGGRIASGLNDRMTSIPLDLTKQLVQEANKIQVLQVRGQALLSAENQLRQEFSIIPDLSRQYTDLQRALQVATESLNRFLSTQEQLQIEASQKAKPWQLLAEPTAFPDPISPGLSRNLMGGLLVGLALGVAVGLLRDRLDNVFHSVEELKEFSRLPILGLIPHYRDLDLSDANVAAPQSQGSQLAAAYKQSEDAYSHTPFHEAFRLLYSNLKFLSSDTPIRSIAISSSLPGDGKSTTSIYVAQAAAAMGQRVLIVDADMRRPQLHARMGLSNMRGLSNILASGLSPDEVIQLADANLSVLTAGQIPPDPTKLLSSHRMASLIEQFESSFDLVLYDTPPLLGLADATLIASHTDGLVLVVGLGKTDRSAFTTVLDHLKLSACPLLGLVANGITQSSNYANGYYYYKSYYNQRPEDSKEKVISLAEHN